MLALACVLDSRIQYWVGGRVGAALCRGKALVEVPQGNQHILMLPADVDDLAVGVVGDGRRQEGVVHVRADQPRNPIRIPNLHSDDWVGTPFMAYGKAIRKENRKDE